MCCSYFGPNLSQMITGMFHFPVLSAFMTNHGFVTRVTRQTPEFTGFFLWFVLLDPQFSVSCFVDRCLSFCSFSFGHCVICLSSICRIWIPIWYLQTLLEIVFKINIIWRFKDRDLLYYLLQHSDNSLGDKHRNWSVCAFLVNVMSCLVVFH